MTIAMTGLSHHTSSIELRERLAFAPDQLRAAIQRLRQRFPNGGVVILNTCNRVEIYARSDQSAQEMHETLRDFLSGWHKVPQHEFREHIYEFQDRDAVAHLFRVASSLDSLVVGEGQILAQVHDAYLAAQAENATDKIISGLFQRAFKAAKEVHTKSSISEGKVSVASVAVDLAISIFMDLADKTVMVIGSGETGELALKCLVSRGVHSVIVVNRTLENAVPLAKEFNGEAVALKDLRTHLYRADIVISSTAAGEPILRVDDFQQALRKREKEPMFVIDIAVPRDIEAGVNELDNIYLYNIDDLEEVTQQNLQARRAEIAYCMELLEGQVDKFMKWRRSLLAEPTLVSIAREFNAIRERELEKTLHTLPELTEKQRAEVEYYGKRIVNTILQRPMTSIKKEVGQEDPHRVLRLVKRLFGLEEGV